MTKDIGVDKELLIRDQLRSLVNKYSPTENETVYEQAVRYGKIAYETYTIDFCKSTGESIVDQFLNWDALSNAHKNAWIEVGTQIEKTVFKDMKDNQY